MLRRPRSMPMMLASCVGMSAQLQGWLLVGLGAWLLLVREILEAGESQGWPSPAIWASLAVVTVAGLAAGW